LWLQLLKSMGDQGNHRAGETNGKGVPCRMEQVNKTVLCVSTVKIFVSLITGWSPWHVSVSQELYLQSRAKQLGLDLLIMSKEVVCHTTISTIWLHKASRETEKTHLSLCF
jgi:hypothetical protein